MEKLCNVGFALEKPRDNITKYALERPLSYHTEKAGVEYLQDEFGEAD